MKTSSFLRPRLFGLALVSAILIPAVATLRAQPRVDPVIVNYTPSIQSLEGLCPLTTSTTIEVESPNTLIPSVAVPVTFSVSIAQLSGTLMMPAGVNLATAEAYASVSPAAATFTGPNQTQTVRVTLTMPANTVAGLYSYKVLANGFSAPSGRSLVNLGSFINAMVSTRSPGIDPPVVAIASPANGAIISLPATTVFPVAVPFSFTATAAGANPKTISSVAAFLYIGDALVVSTQTGTGTLSATGAGNISITGPGTYLITANATNEGGTGIDAHTFTVAIGTGTPTPPTVVINTPLVGSTYQRPASGGNISIPLNFTGTSRSSDPLAVITDLSAAVSGPTATLGLLTKTNLGTRTATGNATITASAPGTYTITVTATDKYGTATTTRTFAVVEGRNICGTVFFDVNYNGVFDGNGDCDDDHRGDDDHHSSSRYGSDWDDCRGSRKDRYSDRGDGRDYGDRHYSRDRDDDDDHHAEDFGLSGVTVRLLSSSRQILATTTTAADGTYCFANRAAGSYIVSAVEPAGFDATTLTERAVTISTKNVVVRDIGFGLDFGQIRNHCADGKSGDFWRTQLDQCIKGDTKNVQVSAAKCAEHTTRIGSLALTVYDGISMKSARSILESNSWSFRDKLSKQLIAAEYNFANGAYINGNKTLTYCFIQWGERVHKTTSAYSNSYAKWAADWFEAYNTSGGGRINGPR